MKIVNYVKGDILKSNATIIIQQCNCFATQGAGLAKQIVSKYPSVLKADKEYTLANIGSQDRLGKYSISEVEPNKFIVNMYSQFGYGREKQHTDYKAMTYALNNIIRDFTHRRLTNIKFAVPYGLGCGLAGGRWNIVSKIIEEAFTKQNWQVYIYSLKDVPELHNKEEKHTMKLIKFAGHHGDDNSKAVFSNWYPSPFYVDGNNDIPIRNVEEYMMLMKAGLFKDDEAILKIRKASTPKEFKSIGRSIKNFNPKLWNENKMDIVTHGLSLKFSQNPNLKNTLLKYYEPNAIFVECAPWDKIWGIGLSADDVRSNNPETWLGENLLGKCLTVVANQFYNEEQNKMVDFKELSERSKYYTDGSFSPKVSVNGGWGFTETINNEEIAYGYGSSIPEGKHVTGEMMAVMQACMHAIKKGNKKITIIYDNEGVYNWCTTTEKRWKTNNERTQGYQKFMDTQIFPKLEITWLWTKSHTNNKWNDRADELAKLGRTAKKNTITL